MEGDRTKRRRIIISQCAPGIEQLPDILLIKVAGYLPKTSRALLVVALTTDSSRWRNVNNGFVVVLKRSIGLFGRTDSFCFFLM